MVHPVWFEPEMLDKSKRTSKSTIGRKKTQ